VQSGRSWPNERVDRAGVRDGGLGRSGEVEHADGVRELRATTLRVFRPVLGNQLPAKAKYTCHVACETNE
jgi:hypothetical protein